VDGAGGSVDEMFDTVVPAPFEGVQKARDVAVDIGMRIDPLVNRSLLKNFSIPARSARSSLTNLKFGLERGYSRRASFRAGS
jgi:hypothetical protein